MSPLDRSQSVDGLRYDDPASVALARVLAQMLDTVDALHDRVVADADPECLHDLRVAVRRSRSLLREIRRVFDRDLRREWRAELRWLQEITGPTRDLDVHLAELEAYRRWLPAEVWPRLAALGDLLDRRRADELRSMQQALGSARVAGFRRAYRAELERLRDGRGVVRASRARDAAAPIGRVAAKRIRSVYREIVERGQELDHGAAAEDLHELRKRGKALRYLLEAFGDVYDPTVREPMVKALKGLQDTLGRFQDREVQTATLRSLAPDLAGLERGPDVAEVIGTVVERLAAEQEGARAAVVERFAAFATPGQIEAVQRAFR